LNGGAIIALLTVVTHQSDPPVITLNTVRYSIVLLVIGLVLAVAAAVLGNLNFERGQTTPSDAKMKRYRNSAFACTMSSLAFFVPEQSSRFGCASKIDRNKPKSANQSTPRRRRNNFMH
jgi:hypothetical protein